MLTKCERGEYLSLLGISLFSFSLLQGKAVTAHADLNIQTEQSSLVIKAKTKDSSTKMGPTTTSSSNSTIALSKGNTSTSNQPSGDENNLDETTDVIHGDTKTTLTDISNVEKQPVAKMAKVVVRYVLDTGGEIRTETLTGKVGEKYTAKAIVFDDKKDFILKGPDTISGVFGLGPEAITFVYKVPRVHQEIKNGMSIYKVFYGDGSLKYVQIVDGKNEITLSRDGKGVPIAAFQGADGYGKGRIEYFTSKTEKKLSSKMEVAYLSARNSWYFFEKNTTTNVVRVFRVNNKSGELSVKTFSLNSSSYSVGKMIGILGIKNQSFIRHFMQPSSNKRRENHAPSNMGPIASTSSDTKLEHNSSAELKKSVTSKSRTDTLPQTSETQSYYAVYGILLFLFSLITPFRGEKKEQ